PHAATHHLAHTDLLDTALRVEGGQAEQAKAGNDNRKPGEGREQLSEPPVVLVQGFEVVAEETPAQGKVGNHALQALSMWASVPARSLPVIRTAAPLNTG